MGLGTGATAAIVGGIGAAGSIASGAIGAHAAGQAADAQTQAANHAADLQAQQAQQALAFEKQVYGDQQTNQRPFLQAGQGATYSLANLLGIRMPQQGATTLPSGNVLNGSSVDPSGFANLTALRGGNGGNFFNPKSLTLQPEGMFPGGAPDPNDLGAAGRFGMMSPNAFGAGVPLPTGGTSSFNTAAPITSPPGTGGMQFQMRPPITSPGTATGTQGQINPPITSPGAGGPYQIQMRPPIMSGGAAGMLNPDGSTGADFTPGQQTLGLNQNPSPNVTNATTNQGSTGQVPITGEPNFLGDQGGGPGGFNGNLTGGPGSADDNSFGSLLKGYGQQFVAPDITEQNDPGYKFRLQQGNDAIQRSAAARGGLLSGGTAKSLSDYAQGSASQEYGNVYNRALSTFDNNYNQYTNDQTQKFNRLASLAGFGQTAAGQLSNAGSNAANNVSSTLLTSGQQIGNDIQNAGAARASGYVGGANAVNGAIGGGTNSLTNAILLSQYL